MTAKDLLNQAMESSVLSVSAATVAATDCTIDPETREIQFVNSELLLGVESDEKSERISFSCPKIVGDNIDLTTLSLRVNFQNANGDKDQYIIEDTKSADDGNITFSWLLSRKVTMYKGKVQFIVCAVRTSDGVITNEWNTTLAEANVLEGLEIGDVPIPQPTQDIIVQLLQLMNASKDAAQASAEEAARTVENGRLQIQQSVDSAVQQIQSRVDVYTQQETHDRFALALKGTADAAQSITIYPDKGSNVIVTAHGFTKQEESGDASPENVRPIVNGGSKVNLFAVPDVESTYIDVNYKVKNGVFSFSGTPAAQRLFKYASFPVDLEPGEYTAMANQYVGGNWAYAFLDDSGERIHYIDKSSLVKRFTFTLPKKCATVELYSYLGSSFTGKYVSCEYIPCLYKGSDDGTPAAPNVGSEYAAVLGEANGEGVAIPLSAPLCQGDKLITKVKSGCDKSITFDGSSDENWIQAYAQGGRYVYSINAGQYVSVAHTNWLPFTKSLSSGSVDTYFGLYTISPQTNFNVNIPVGTISAASVDEWKAYLAEHPLTVWYRSNDYTDGSNKMVSFEIHARWVQVLNGKEAWATAVAGAYYMFPSNLPKPSGASSTTDAISDYLKAAPTNDIAAGTEGFGIGPSGSIAVRLPGGVEPSAYMTDKPLTVVYQLNAAVTFAHDPVEFIASPDEDGAWVITGEADGTVSATYNKNITKAFEELQAAVLAAVAKLSL